MKELVEEKVHKKLIEEKKKKQLREELREELLKELTAKPSMRNPANEMKKNRDVAYLNNELVRYSRGEAFVDLTDLQFDTFMYLCVRAKALENWTDIIEIEPKKYFEGMGRYKSYSKLSAKQKTKCLDEIDNLQDKSFAIYTKDPDCEGRYIRERYNYIRKSKYTPSKNIIEVELDPNTKDLINKYDKNFTPVKLEYFINLKTLYSKILYLYFRSFLSEGHSSYTLVKLRQLLGLYCPEKDINKYERWIDLKKHVLIPAVKNINTKTDIQIIGHYDKYQELLEKYNYPEDEDLLAKIAVDSMVNKNDKVAGSKQVNKIFFNVSKKKKDN